MEASSPVDHLRMLLPCAPTGIADMSVAMTMGSR